MPGRVTGVVSETDASPQVLARVKVCSCSRSIAGVNLAAET